MIGIADLLAWIGRRIGKPPGWERVVRTFVPPEKCASMRDICVVRDGLVFVAQPAVPLGWHVAFFGTYEPELREVFRTVLPAGGVSVDVGANVGWHTLLMGRLVGPGGRVLAAEANPSVRARLEENLALNRLPQVEVLPFALSDADGSLDFFGPDALDPWSGNGYVVPAAAGRPDTIRVEARRLDTLLAAAQIERLDLIKIDVEGFEWRVLEGAEQSIANFRPHIVFEYNADYAARGNGRPELFEAFFARHGYRLFAIGRNWAESVDLKNWPACADIWAVPRSRG